MKTCLSILSILIFTIANAGATESLEDLKNDITLLKSAIKEQGERIRVLEQIIVGKKNEPSKEVDPSRISTNSPTWHASSSWEKIKSGMSKSQVVNLLGEPTSVKDQGGDQGGTLILLYSGEVSGSGSVSGNVKLSYDRVFEVNKPVF